MKKKTTLNSILLTVICSLLLITTNLIASAATKKYIYSMPSKEKFFITKNIGWKASYDAQGMFKESMTLYKTNDGGKKWTKIADTDTLKTIPYEGDKTGMSFISKLKGWITAYAPWVGKFGFYTTDNGGKNWHEQKLLVPKLFKQSEINPYPPLIMSSSDALIVAFPDSSENKPHLLVYITHNGGNTWTAYADKHKGSSNSINWTTLNKTLNKLSVVNKNNKWTFDGQKWTIE